jgi:hypothetical protein
MFPIYSGWGMLSIEPLEQGNTFSFACDNNLSLPVTFNNQNRIKTGRLYEEVVG